MYTFWRKSFQERVYDWAERCFGFRNAGREDLSYVRDVEERGLRFLEEAVELAQAITVTKEQAHAIVEYVYNRPIGHDGQEVGGVLITLAVLCSVLQIDMAKWGELELIRVNTPEVMEKIRQKQLGKQLPAAVRSNWGS